MQDKIIEIIVYILNQIKGSKQFADIDVKDLTDKGYTNSEINTAFAWIYSKINETEKVYSANDLVSKSHRFYNKNEKNLLTPEAEGYLIQMRELGIISSNELETIFDRILYLGYMKAGVEEIKHIISSLLFESDNNSETLNRLILLNNDTIH